MYYIYVRVICFNLVYDKYIEVIHVSTLFTNNYCLKLILNKKYIDLFNQNIIAIILLIICKDFWVILFSHNLAVKDCKSYLQTYIRSEFWDFVNFHYCQGPVGIMDWWFNWTVLNFWSWNETDAILQTFSNAFSSTNIDWFRLRYHWSLFSRVQLTIFQ